MKNEDKKVLIDAMGKAEDAFFGYLEKRGLDAAYYCLDLQGYVLADDFHSIMELVKFENYEAVRKRKNEQVKK